MIMNIIDILRLGDFCCFLEQKKAYRMLIESLLYKSQLQKLTVETAILKNGNKKMF